MLAKSATNEAIGWAKQALGKENGWESAIPALAAAYQAKGDRHTALTLAEAEAAKKPASGLASYFIAQIYFRNEDLSKAEKALAKSIELMPEWIDPLRLMATIYAQQGRIDSATTEMELLYRKEPTPSVILSLAVLYEQKGRLGDTSLLFDEFLQKSNQSPAIMNDQAYLYAEHRTDPDDLEKAANLASMALAREPANPAFIDTSAWVAYKRGNLDAAWYGIQSSLALKPHVGLANFHAAVIAHARGEKSQASKYLEKALEDNLAPVSHDKALELKKELDTGR
jgi:tetratricopeptide (TPR) repeat protein